MGEAARTAMSLEHLGGLAAFAGRWSGRGQGHYPTIADFAYREEIELAPSPKPFLAYVSRTWNLETGAPMHTENGYLRHAGSDGGGDAVELIVSQPTGFTEIHAARLDAGVLDFALLSLSAAPTAKPVREIRRRIELSGDRLAYDIWMAHAETPLTHHLRAELHRS